jgi:hypothetical protein
MSMNEAEIRQYITSTFEDVHVVEAWGDTFFFYNPGPETPDEIYFATLKSKDDEYDNSSDLNRDSVYRLNIGIGKATYRSLFGAPPSRHDPKRTAETAYDFSALDQLMPHPVYGHIYWVCVLNPSEETFAGVQPLLAEAYALAVDRYRKKSMKRAAHG